MSQRKPRVYVASSWRNEFQPAVVDRLRAGGLDVYDFRSPPHGRGGFAWSDIDPNWLKWTPDQWRDALKHPLAVAGYHSDRDGMEWADMCVLVLPCGRSAHLEAGWFAGRGLPVAVLAITPQEPDLMVSLTSGGVQTSVDSVIEWCLQQSREATRECVVCRQPADGGSIYCDGCRRMS